MDLVRFVILSRPRAALRLAARYTDGHGSGYRRNHPRCAVLALLPFAAFSGAHVAALLCAIVVACCFDVYPHARLRFAAAGRVRAGGAVRPEFSALLPVVAYVLFGERFWLVRLSWIMPLAAALRTQDVLLVPAAVLCAAACLMAWRTKRAGEERERYRALRDEQQEASLSLANKNRELMAAQDYEVRLATLSERSRIAREIHDNVGHLLTRSVLQVEALQVVHADDECVRGGLASVGATLHEAMDTVRKSVHDLHDDAFDLRARLEGVIGRLRAWTTCASCTTSRMCRFPSPTAWWPFVPRGAVERGEAQRRHARRRVGHRIPGSLPAHRAG